VSPSTQATRCRFHCHTYRTAGILLASLSLMLATGCGSFIAQGRNSEGVRLFHQAEYQQALQHFQDAINTDPQDADGYYNLAATYHRMGVRDKRESDLKMAEDYYNQCLDRDENHTDCYRGLAVLLAEQGRVDAAFRLIKGWGDQYPDSVDAKIELARLSEEHNRRSDAKDHLIEALKIDPDNPRALAALGKIREDMGDHVQALEDYQRSLQGDRFQLQVASRVSALQSKIGQRSWSAGPDDGTRLVDRESAPLR